MYDNIAKKVKGLAKGIFIIEALGTIVTGIMLLITGELALFGLIILICGPLIAWVSSWVLYAFGELVEDVGIIRYQTQIEKNTTSKSNGLIQSKITNNTPAVSNANKILCKTCGADISADISVCHVCGKELNNLH